VSKLARCAEAEVVGPDELDPARSTGYRVPLNFPPLDAAAWHEGEENVQWTAARRAELPVIVNPGERRVTIEAVSYRPAALAASVFVGGEAVGEMRWARPGALTATFSLPSVADGPLGGGTELSLAFEVAELWQPDGDDRSLGIGITSVCFEA
jgi:hypothetical protein